MDRMGGRGGEEEEERRGRQEGKRDREREREGDREPSEQIHVYACNTHLQKCMYNMCIYAYFIVYILFYYSYKVL